MPSSRQPQDYRALDITFSKTDSGHVYMFIGEHYMTAPSKDDKGHDVPSEKRPGRRAFHLCLTDAEKRQLSDAFMASLVETYNAAHAATKVIEPVAPKTAPAFIPDWLARLSEDPKAAPAPSAPADGGVRAQLKVGK